MKACRPMWFVPIFLLAMPGDLFAQSNVESRVGKLEETIRVLEQRIAALEEQLRSRPAPAPAASGKVNWRRLQKGISEGDVEQILGSPLRIDVFGSFAIWHYSNSGQVQFDGDTRTVFSWHEPR